MTTLESSAEKLLALLDAAVRNDISGREAAVAFSGGLDSTLIAKIASKYAAVHAYTVGIEGAYDLSNAEKSAALIGIPIERIIVKKDDVSHAAEKVRKLIPSASVLDVHIATPLYLLCEHLHEKGVEEVLIGQGADELFGGYAKYEKLSGVDLQKKLNEDYANLAGILKGRDCAVALHNRVTLKTPYLEKKVADFALSLPVGFKVNKGRKIVLREAARLAGLPPEVCAQPKKAIQYGSGVSKVL